MKNAIIFLICLSVSTYCFSSVTFDISKTGNNSGSGMVPFELTIVDNSTASFGETISSRSYLWGDGSDWTTDLTHIYTKRGVFGFTVRIITDVDKYQKTYSEFVNTNIYVIGSEVRSVTTVFLRDGSSSTNSPLAFGSDDGYLYSIDYGPNLIDQVNHLVTTTKTGESVIYGFAASPTNCFVAAVRDKVGEVYHYHVRSMNYSNLSTVYDTEDFDDQIVLVHEPEEASFFVIATANGGLYGYTIDPSTKQMTLVADNIEGGIPTGSGLVGSCSVISNGLSGFIYKQCLSPVNRIEKYSFTLSPPGITLEDSVVSSDGDNLTTMIAYHNGIDIVLALGTNDGRILQYDGDLGFISSVSMHSSAVTSISTRDNELFVASGSVDKSVKVWYSHDTVDSDFGDVVKSYYRIAGGVSQIEVGRNSVDDKTYLVVGTDQGNIHVKTCSEWVNDSESTSSYNILYAIEGGNGWANSYVDIWSIMKKIGSNPIPAEIWIKQGTTTFTPDSDRYGYQMKNGVSLYGDFEGTELFRNSSKVYNPDNTVLTLDGEGRVLRGSNNSTICGFTISGGELSDFGSSGAGLYADSVNMNIQYCKFTDNESVSNGSDVYAFKGGLSFYSCTFEDSKKTNVSLLYGDHILTKCLFKFNTNSEWGIYINGSNCTVSESSFYGVGQPYGYAVYSKSDSTVVDRSSFSAVRIAVYNAPEGNMDVTNSLFMTCILQGDNPINLGSMVYSGYMSSLDFDNNTVVGNVTDSSSTDSSLFFFDSMNQLRFRNNILWGNTYTGGGHSVTNLAASEGIDPLLRHRGTLLWTEDERFDFTNDFIYTKTKVNVGEQVKFYDQDGCPAHITSMFVLYYVVSVKPFGDGYAFQIAELEGGSPIDFHSNGDTYAPVLIFLNRGASILNNLTDDSFEYPYSGSVPIGFDQNTLEEDPLFIDALYKIDASSPCYDTGQNVTTIDFYGRVRPQGAYCDRGYYEVPQP